jgi:hypothetical protein
MRCSSVMVSCHGLARFLCYVRNSQAAHHLFLIIILVLAIVLLVVLLFIIILVIVYRWRMIVSMMSVRMHTICRMPIAICISVHLLFSILFSSHSSFGKLFHHLNELLAVILEQIVCNGEYASCPQVSNVLYLSGTSHALYC